MDNPIVVFDGVCNLCNNVVKFIIKRDKRNQFRFASFQGKKGNEILKHFRLNENDTNSFLLIQGDKIYFRSGGALRVLKKLGGWYSLLYAFIIVPKFLRDPIYNWVARNRYKWFGKKDSCMVPTTELKERFLD